MNVDLNKTEKKVVSLLIEDSEYTSDELAAKIGVTKRTIIQNYSELCRITECNALYCYWQTAEREVFGI